MQIWIEALYEGSRICPTYGIPMSHSDIIPFSFDSAPSGVNFLSLDTLV